MFFIKGMLWTNILKINAAFEKVEPRRQDSAAPKITFGSGSRRILVRHPVAEGAFIPRQNRGPSA